MKKISTTLLSFLLTAYCMAQGHFPWENPLMIARSNDGKIFNSPVIFQDSSGVPCVIRWKSDTLIATFQWFRQPMGSPSWDRVAVKFSYDNGNTWTAPSPIVVTGLPANYQRPFDPTITVTSDKKIRIYYSSSDGMTPGGLNAVVNTYSAISNDGVNYVFEPNARFDHPTNRVIDPAVTFFNGLWHYLSPIGAPQDGTYHCTSADGLLFAQQANYVSDNTHNWTGNFVVANLNELRFYGCGPTIWYTSSSDGIAWSAYTNTNLVGGDPGIVKLSNNSYIIIYVGQPYPPTTTTTAVEFKLKPNTVNKTLFVGVNNNNPVSYIIYNSKGQRISSSTTVNNAGINISNLAGGIYFITLSQNETSKTMRFLKR